MVVILILAALFLGFVNGANDTFKGVATLFGSGTLSYRRALAWAAFTTFLGSGASILLHSRLLQLFSGSGLVTSEVLSHPTFLLSVALGAGLVILVATLAGLPVSTTHGLVGGLLGAGIASGGLAKMSPLLALILLPLILSPAISIVLTAIAYQLLHWLRVRTDAESTSCLCVQENQELLAAPSGAVAVRTAGLAVVIQHRQYCEAGTTGKLAGFSLQKTLDSAHLVSAGAQGFARGFNDTPKMAAILVTAVPMFPKLSFFAIAVFMTMGGILKARKVAQKMSHEITQMNPGQAFTANSITALLVILGSIAGFPVSTTHVSCGSLFGIGLVSRQAKFKTIVQIAAAWLITLPMAALFSAFIWCTVK